MNARILIALLLVTTALAGCGDKSALPDETKGGIQTGGGIDADHLLDGEGAVRGVVTDDIAVPVAQATVSLAGTDHITRTASDGRFFFTNVTEGEYNVKVTHAQYHPFQGKVAVAEKKIMEVTVVLVPLKVPDSQYRPHIHDHWAGQTQLTMIDGTSFDWNAGYQTNGDVWAYVAEVDRIRGQAAFGDCVNGSGEMGWWNRAVWFDDPSQLVWAGTASIEVTLRWEETDFVGDALALGYRGANSSAFTEVGPIENGQPVTFDIDADDWDSSHQTFTLWDFYVCRTSDDDTDTGTFGSGSFAMTLKLHRMEGDIPPEPAHPIFWPENGVLPVYEPKETRKEMAYIYDLDRNPRRDSGWTFTPDEGLLVPPGTDHLLVRVAWAWDSTGPGRDDKWTLGYSPANVRPYELGDPADLPLADILVDGDTERVFRIDLQSGEADQFYQKKSNWRFMLHIEGEEDSKQYVASCVCWANFDIDVYAYKDKAYAEG